jgi:hypothetical protein
MVLVIIAMFSLVVEVFMMGNNIIPRIERLEKNKVKLPEVPPTPPPKAPPKASKEESDEETMKKIKETLGEILDTKKRIERK